MRLVSIHVTVTIQLAVVLLAFGTMLMSPPARGMLWLVPVGKAGRGDMVRLAIGGGARLVADGPGGSVVVFGERTRLWRPLLAAAVVTLAAPAAACGPGTAAEAAA